MLAEERAINVRQLGPCKACAWVPLRLSWQTFSNGTRHLRGECSVCGGFVCYVKQTLDAVAEAEGLNGRDEEPEDASSLFLDVRNLATLVRPSEPWSDVHRRLALALDQCGDAKQRGDAEFIRSMRYRMFKFFRDRQEVSR